jgi:alpha-ketoglutarate-dependent 2,4-dichlorophenoxyacetate dioxygenase
MELTVTPLHEDFGARLEGLTLSEPVEPGLADVLKELMDEHSLLVLPDQACCDELQLAVTRVFGEPEHNHVILGREGRIEYFGNIGNVTDSGKQLGNDHPQMIFLSGNNMWHSDSSFREVPSRFSLMCVYEVPDEGGETEFVSTRAAHARLPDDYRAKIEPLIAIHDYVFSRSKVGKDAVTPSHAASLPPVQQRLVRRNPVNGRANFYVGSHAREIVGMVAAEGRLLLDDLLERATAPEYVYRHRWEPGQLVIWDNRCLLHRGTGFDADRYRRRMRQTRVAGDGSTLEQPA